MFSGIATSDVVERLRAEGCDVCPSYVTYLTRDGILHPPAKVLGRLLWTEPDIDRLRSELRRRGRGPVETHAGREACHV